MVMEASSMVMMNPSSSSSCSFKKHASSSTMGFAPYRNSLKMGGFCDKGELEYYKSSVRIRCGGENKKVKVEEKKKKKKGGKLVKGLSRDLSVFYGMGFGLDSQYYQQKQLNQEGVVDQVKLKMMSEAAELLLEQLKQVRAEDKELKKKMKEEKKKIKAEKKSTMSVSRLEESSSSSSSESSDSESDNETVVDLNRLKGGLQLPQQQQSLPVIVPTISTLHEDGDVSLLPTTTAAVLEQTYRREAGVHSGVGILVNQQNNRIGAELGGMVGNKIEVCMGGKCKKSGAATLVEEFQRVVGFNPDIAVSGCKCMGKCKEGPNVRVVNTQTSEAVTVKNPLCLGVGVEDVGLIVSNFFGDETGVVAVPVPALESFSV